MSQTQEVRSGVELNHYSYRVVWSPEDGEYVATALEWGPALSWLDEDPTVALAGLRDLIRGSIADLTADGKPAPAPLADRDYSGRLLLRMPAEASPPGVGDPACPQNDDSDARLGIAVRTSSRLEACAHLILDSLLDEFERLHEQGWSSSTDDPMTAGVVRQVDETIADQVVWLLAPPVFAGGPWRQVYEGPGHTRDMRTKAT